MCEYAGFPGYKWGSATDDTGKFPSLTCSKLETPLPGGSLREQANWYKLAQLIAEL